VEAKDVKQYALDCGADIVGIADLMLLSGIPTIPRYLLQGYTRAVSMAVRLSNAVIDAIDDAPTPLYQQHYLRVNAFLDEIALRVTRYLEKRNGRALPIPASQLLDKASWHSYISHKAVAIAAGIGWQGKSLLVVSPEHGPRIRLVTVLTDLPLNADKPVSNRCGKCSKCADSCPAQAIKNVNTTGHYSDRDEALHFERCVAKLTQEFPELPFIESPICGVCIRACPWGKRTRALRSNSRSPRKDPTQT